MIDNKRQYDIAIFGASGYTGEYVIEELALYTQGINWCVAGRSSQKLRNVLEKLSKEIDKDVTGIDILEADVTDVESLAIMCKSSSLIINCVGPYRFYGEKVVEQCVKWKTHYVDVSGEPQFLETIQVKYFDQAKAQEIYIVGSCGFDSIPCDLGVEIARKSFGGDVNSVETYLSVKQPPDSTVNFGTWQSAIHGLAHAEELKPLRKSLKEQLFPKSIPMPAFPLKSRGTLFKSQEAKGWCIPFIGSDKSVILRTQMYNYNFKNERPVQVQTYMRSRSLFHAIVTLLMAAIFMLMTKFALGRDLLEKFPEIFSLGMFSRFPPKKEKASSGSFRVLFIAKGWTDKQLDPADQSINPPDKIVETILKGTEPAYISTAICVVSSALVILSEKDKLPLKGGVFTPGVAFSDTTLQERLGKRGITLETKN